jgi:serine/threonine protein kinase
MKKDKISNNCPIIINESWKLLYKIGGGSFGDIYEASHVTTKKSYAVKLETLKETKTRLDDEYKCYKVFKGIEGIPQIYYYGPLYEYKCLVMEILGPSLEDLFNFCNRQFSLKTVCMIANQMLNVIEKVHGKYFIHRDIKPANFLMGIDDKSNLLYLVDFGLSKQYKTRIKGTQTYLHIEELKNKNLTGTPRYVSVKTHQNIEQSRRDDLESIGYVLIYFLNGSLPWQGLNAAVKKEKYKKIEDLKVKFEVESLKRAKIPVELSDYLKYCKDLGFETDPDYNKLRGFFVKISEKEGFKFDHVYDWHLQCEKNFENKNLKK